MLVVRPESQRKYISKFSSQSKRIVKVRTTAWTLYSLIWSMQIATQTRTSLPKRKDQYLAGSQQHHSSTGFIRSAGRHESHYKGTSLSCSYCHSALWRFGQDANNLSWKMRLQGFRSKAKECRQQRSILGSVYATFFSQQTLLTGMSSMQFALNVIKRIFHSNEEVYNLLQALCIDYSPFFRGQTIACIIVKSH